MFSFSFSENFFTDHNGVQRMGGLSFRLLLYFISLFFLLFLLLYLLTSLSLSLFLSFSTTLLFYVFYQSYIYFSSVWTTLHACIAFKLSLLRPHFVGGYVSLCMWWGFILFKNVVGNTDFQKLFKLNYW